MFWITELSIMEGTPELRMGSLHDYYYCFVITATATTLFWLYCPSQPPLEKSTFPN